MTIKKPKQCKYCGKVFSFSRDDGLIYEDLNDRWLIHCSGCDRYYYETIEKQLSNI